MIYIFAVGICVIVLIISAYKTGVYSERLRMNEIMSDVINDPEGRGKGAFSEGVTWTFKQLFRLRRIRR